jgi:hypothetical protein
MMVSGVVVVVVTAMSHVSGFIAAWGRNWTMEKYVLE